MKLVPFDFDGAAVRVVREDDGQPWFLAKDVCDILGTQTRDVRKILDADEVETLALAEVAPTLTGVKAGGRPSLIVSESGLYSLVLRSRKRAAKKFRRWITGEVIPRIMRTGRYALSEPLCEMERVHRETVEGYLALRRQPGERPPTLEETIRFGSIVRRLNQALGIAYEFDHVPGLGKVRTYAVELLDQAWMEFEKRRRDRLQLELWHAEEAA